jgi:hypothetical protein
MFRKILKIKIFSIKYYAPTDGIFNQLCKYSISWASAFAADDGKPALLVQMSSIDIFSISRARRRVQ